MKVLVILFSVCLWANWSTVSNGNSNWGYESSNGPLTWGSNYPICNGLSQSPINVPSIGAVENETLGKFNRSLFDNLPDSMLLHNTGHSLQVDLTNGYYISDASLLPATFQADQFHIHWAKPNEMGSEHMVDGVQYFGELHIVHHNTKYSDFNAAKNKSDGLAVIAFFIQNDYPQDNLAFGRFLPTGNFYTDNQTNLNPTFSVESFLPPDLDMYYRYRGSLTTPTCDQSVVWTVFQNPIRISMSQSSILQSKIYSTPSTTTSPKILSGNFRPTQPLNNRKVYKPVLGCGNGVSTLHVSFYLLLLCFVKSLYLYFI